MDEEEKKGDEQETWVPEGPVVINLDEELESSLMMHDDEYSGLGFSAECITPPSHKRSFNCYPKIKRFNLPPRLIKFETSNPSCNKNKVRPNTAILPHFKSTETSCIVK